MLSRSQILRALRAAARQLGRAPTRAEFLRLTGIHYGRLIPHFPAIGFSLAQRFCPFEKTHILTPRNLRGICCGQKSPFMPIFALTHGRTNGKFRDSLQSEKRCIERSLTKEAASF